MSAKLETLMAQATDTAHVYMFRAVESIDRKFGEGYAEKHPELVGAFMQTAALDFLAVTLHNKRDGE
jgi:hypothetical protein